MFGINKNGTKHKIGIIMPANYPSARVTFDPTVKNILPNTATDCQKAIDAVSDYLKLEDVSASVSFTAACTSGSSMKVIKYGKLVHVIGTIIAAANTSSTTILATGLPSGSSLYGSSYVIVNPSFKNKSYQMGIGIPGSGNAGALRFLYPAQGLVANEDLNIDITYFTD